MEEDLTLDELKAIIESNRKEENRRNKFFALLIKGVNLDDPNDESDEERIDRIKKQAEAKLRGVPEEKIVYDELGFGFETEG